MPAFGWQLNDAQVAAVATYVRNHWGKAPPVSEDEAKKERATRRENQLSLTSASGNPWTPAIAGCRARIGLRPQK